MNRQQETIFEDEATTNHQNPRFQSPIKSRLTVNPSEDNNSVTLTHTVSFYRRQQTLNSPSVQKAIHRTQPIFEQITNDENSDFDEEDMRGAQETKFIRSEEDLVEQKIQSLKSIINVQNQQISQASNALTTCASTFEFSGSTESVVAEWKLLVASK